MPTDKKDYYEILGVSRDATESELKSAYRKLAHKYHPDKNGGDPDKFKEVNEAYSVLGDEKKRAEYNTYGRTFSGGQGGFNGQQQGGFQGQQITPLQAAMTIAQRRVAEGP